MSTNSLEKYFRKYSTFERSSVQYFCCDMYDGYVSFQKKMFPKAILCVDRFHVIKRLNLCLAEIRRRLQNEHKYVNPSLYKLLKDSRYLLLTKEESNAPVAILSADLSGWIDHASSSFVPELRQAACTIKKWKPYIMNSIRYGKSNGPCEGFIRVVYSVESVFIASTALLKLRIKSYKE